MKKFIRVFVLVLTVANIFVSSSSAFATAKYDPDFYSAQDILIYNPDDDTCSDSTNSTTASVAALTGTDNRQKIWNFFIAKGLTPQQAAGIMGNLQTESANSWNPIINELGQTFGKGGLGLAQWTNTNNSPGGRRDILVTALKTAAADAMAKYYTGDYSAANSITNQAAGFVPKSAATGTPMDTVSNDTLLLAELNYLYSDSSNRTVSPAAIAKGLGVKGETEWDAITKQTTVAGASNLWVYSFEIPASIDQTAAARVVNGGSILALFTGTSSDGTACPTTPAAEAGGTKQQLAQQITANPNITYEGTAEAARQKKLIADVASGASNGNTFPCGVNIQILRVIAALGTGHKIRINDLNRACTSSLAGGASTTSSRHYAGDGSAVDLGTFDGKAPYLPANATVIVSIVAPLLVGHGGNIGQVQCAGLTSAAIHVPAGIGRFNDACTHLHVEVNPNTDPNLQCKYPVGGGTCVKPQRIN